jgi:hypothetical protein
MWCVSVNVHVCTCALARVCMHVCVGVRMRVRMRVLCVCVCVCVCVGGPNSEVCNIFFVVGGLPTIPAIGSPRSPRISKNRVLINLLINFIG